MRTLIVMRHAKSDYPPGVPDADRPLSPRGVRDASAARDWLRAACPRIDVVKVSPAVRAQQTLDLISPGLVLGAVDTDSRIYLDWGEQLPAVVAELDPAARTALIVGHNPGIEDYAMSMCRDRDAPACVRLSAKYPTAGIGVVAFPRAWADQSSAELVVFAVPRATA